jgi:hypothetical protein
MAHQHSRRKTRKVSVREVEVMYQVFNDRGWHYKCANVVLYHLYNKYVWLQTENPILSSEYPHWLDDNQRKVF